MAVSILDNCTFNIENIQTIWIGSRTTGGTSIVYPIEYITVSGSNDTIIKIEEWDFDTDIVKIGGQYIQMNRIINTGDNITYEENLTIDNNGKRYIKRLGFTIPNITLYTNNQIKELVMTENGKFSLSPTLALLIDGNGETLIVGLTNALYLQTNEIIIGDENAYNLTYQSASYQRAKEWQL